MNNRFFKKSISLMLSAICVVGMIGCASGNSTNSPADEVNNDSVHEAEIISDEAGINNANTIDISNANFVNEGKLTVGMVVDYPPFEYYPNNGNFPIGVDVDIANAIATNLGLELEIKDVPWDDNLFTNMGSEYDVVCSAVTITEDRMQDMLFSHSYIDNYQSVVIRKNGNITAEKFEDLNGLTVAVQKDTVSDELMLNLIDSSDVEINLIENDVATDCFEQLEKGQIDAIVCDSTVADGQIARNADLYAEAYRDEKNVEQFAIAISKDNAGLQQAINEALDKLQEEGTEKVIINSWFSR